jgi:S-adenosylmethionine:diacylglycerol 3-amino-3-carboxypropyl transferase
VTAVLRQAVLEAFRTREQYVARLVETDAASWMTEMSAKSLRRAVRASLIDSGVRVIESTDEGEHFVVVEGEGDGFEVVRPAYLDQATGKLILSGQLRRVFVPGGHADSRTEAPDASETEEKP